MQAGLLQLRLFRLSKAKKSISKKVARSKNK